MAESLRRVKWAQEATDFWENAEDGSVELQFVVSYGAISQTEKGLEDLINTINDPFYKRKIKKLFITDTSYLYRHCIDDFKAYIDPSIPTIWFLSNEATLKQLQVDTEFVSWAEGLQKPQFKEWYKKIKSDFDGDGSDSRIVRQFRDCVFIDSTLSSYKGDYDDMGGCIDFMLEECAYACAFLKGCNLLYPMNLARCMENAFERYDISVNLLNYKTSRHAQKHTRYRDNRFDMLDKEIALFMREKVSNVNFFVIDEDGNHIYKNYALQKIVEDDNAKNLSSESWQNSLKVMQLRETCSFEESYMDKIYFCVKSPFIVNDEVEGVIGLSVDITERKKLEIIERKKEVQSLAESVVHDIRSPLMVLSLLANDAFLPEKKHLELKNIIKNIETILEDLLAKYKGTEKPKTSREESICIQVALFESMRLMRYQYADSNVEFDYVPDADFRDECVFIKGNYSDFCRMLSNLMNNAVESLKKDACGIVKIGIKKNNDETVSLFVKDNGCGMPPETVDQLMNKHAVQTTKEGGHGLGMQQIIKTVDDMQGRLLVNSTENVGTEFCVTFPQIPTPEWFCDTLHMKKGDTVIVLDDSRVVFDAWGDVFTTNDVFVKYFTNGNDVMNFIASFDDKSQLFLIADYELRGQELNGVDIIELSGMGNQALLVTNSRVSEIKSFNNVRVKVFPKLCGLDKIKVIIE